MRAPGFWRHGRGGVASLALAPIGWCYGAATGLRQTVGKHWRAPVPVVCVGNLIAGGAGKTPVVLEIARRLMARGRAAHMLTRGYGGTEFGPLRVSPGDEARKVGDEALLLAKSGPAWIADDRSKGVREAVEAGAEAIVFDDGFQDPAVAKDLSVLVIDGGYGFGNGRMIPAGPLRESVDAGLARADAAILIGEDRCGALDAIAARVPVIRAKTRLLLPPQASQGPVFAFAGIGRPEKFFGDLESAGLELRGRRPFADHHQFSDAELATLRTMAAETDAKLVTTEKDWVRLPQAMQAEVLAVPLELEWEDRTALDALLDRMLDGDG